MPERVVHPPVHFTTTADGVRIAYCVHGAGPPLVFVRGWVSHLELLWEDPRFRRFIEALSRHHRVIRYDARGNGLSDREPTRVDLDALVADLEAVVQHQGARDVVLYGATFGGPIAIAFAARHPDLVSRLILDGTYAAGRHITSRARQTFITRSLRRLPDAAFLLLSHVTRPDGSGAPYDAARVRQAIDPQVAARLYAVAFATDVTDQLPGLRMPALVLHRRQSEAVPYRLGCDLAAAIPGAEFVPLAGAAHNPWEGDATAVLEAVAAFLGVSRPGPEPEETASPAALAAGPATTSLCGPYRLLGPISEGRMGVVYRAQDTRLGRTVVLKFLPEPLARDHAALERFRRESRAAAALNHPNICTVFDIGEQAGRPYIVMESLSGETLRERLAKGLVPLSQLAAWGAQIADALDAAHTVGIVHRDIKPANVFVTLRQTVKVLDFGLAKLLAPDETGLATRTTVTAPGLLVGTWGYMSPEQLQGGSVDARSDLFSLGVVLFEMATGRLPFATDPQAGLGAALGGVAAAGQAIRTDPALPAPLRPIVERTLQLDPAARYPSAALLRDDLARLCAGPHPDAVTSVS
ncbi:MAG: alpha/beta fold hydrolase [Acidobacteriota bacterium]|nr:alpha/beta fold hydrolase [Acidobacteriota bacterium]